MFTGSAPAGSSLRAPAPSVRDRRAADAPTLTRAAAARRSPFTRVRTAPAACRIRGVERSEFPPVEIEQGTVPTGELQIQIVYPFRTVDRTRRGNPGLGAAGTLN